MPGNRLLQISTQNTTFRVSHSVQIRVGQNRTAADKWRPRNFTLCILCCFRHRPGLVGPCLVVAGAEHVAVAAPLHPGSVRGAGRRPPPLHAHAQELAGAATRPPGAQLAGGLLHQVFHSRRAAL